jgi:hypothetical protein
MRFVSYSPPEAGGGTSVEDGRSGKRGVRNAEIYGV